ncbi:DUF4157 domain-containing protein [Nitrosomonas sp.]|uniref:eCIS core domain-containing protein n=1 Tax=Nitrosomonas sp. TaxID=42353 RepID=UPI00207FB38D|nr:DUF4157 domain-containing protein [Nitrosomonas sp.]GJL76409.1 MAG: hypothetical protein NMNS02_25150 [Nitrosomonas sp.]
MAKQHLTEVSDKAKANEAYRVSSPDSAQSFQRGVQPISQLQRTLGNRDVARLIQAKRLSPSGEIMGLQRKLTVGAADDQYEQEADQVARQVMSMPDAAVANNSMQRTSSQEDDQEKMVQTKPLATSITPFVQREIINNEEDNETPVQAKLASVQREISPEEDKDNPVQAKIANEINRKTLQRQPEAVDEEEEPIQAKSAGSMSDSFEAGDDVESQISQSKGLGSPLPDPVRNYMEPRFGVDFSDVRVHTGNEAVQMNRAVGAQAFTHGSDVYFGEGRSPNNLELTAHELTHVVQQTGGDIRPKTIESDPVGAVGDSVQKKCAGCAADDSLQRTGSDDAAMIPQAIGDTGHIAGSQRPGTALRPDRDIAVGSPSSVLIQRVGPAVPALAAAIKALTLTEAITVVGTVVSSAASVVGLVSAAQNDKTNVGPDSILDPQTGDYMMSDFDRDGLAQVFRVLYFEEMERLVEREQSSGTVVDDARQSELKQTAIGNVKFKLTRYLSRLLATKSEEFVQQGDGGTSKETPWGSVMVSVEGGEIVNPSASPVLVEIAERHHVTVPERPMSFIKRVKLSFESEKDWNLTWNDDIYVRATKLAKTQSSHLHVGIEAEVAFDWDGDTTRYEWDGSRLITFNNIPSPAWRGETDPDD